MAKVFVISGANGAGKSTLLLNLKNRVQASVFDCDDEDRPFEGWQDIRNATWHLDIVARRLSSAIKEVDAGNNAIVFGLIPPDEIMALGYDVNSPYFRFIFLNSGPEAQLNRVINVGKATAENETLLRFMKERAEWLQRRFRQTVDAAYIDTNVNNPENVSQIVLSLIDFNSNKPVPCRWILGGSEDKSSEWITVPGVEIAPRDPFYKLEQVPDIGDRPIDALLRAVEPYQPLWGAPELKHRQLQRIAFDRAWAIENAIGRNAVAGKRILDIGSALGFFSL